jgi:hypothetical protein
MLNAPPHTAQLIHAFRSWTFLFFLFLFVGNSALAQHGTEFDLHKEIPEDSLISDLNLLQRALEEVHPGLFRYNSETTFTTFMSDIKQDIDGPLSSGDFYQYVARIIAGINDGHSRASYDGAVWDEAKLFPFTTAVYDEQLYIVQNLCDNDTLEAGMEILSINGKTTASVLKRLKAHLSSDGFIETMKEAELARTGFAKYYFLIFGETDGFEIGVATPAGEEIYDVPAGLRVDLLAHRLKRYGANEPFTPFKSHYDTASKTQILTINTFMPYKYRKAKMTFTRKIRKSFKSYNKSGAESLIIDLRGNTGGQMGYATYLFNYMTDREVEWFGTVEAKSTTDFTFSEHLSENKSPGINRKNFIVDSLARFVMANRKKIRPSKPHKHRFKGDIYLLIGGSSLSASALLAAEVQQNKFATLIGEESGGAYREFSAGATVTLVLPNSGIKVQIPVFNLTLDLPEQEIGRGVIPEHQVQTSIEQLIAGEDAVLEYAFSLIKRAQ